MTLLLPIASAAGPLSASFESLEFQGDGILGGSVGAMTIKLSSAEAPRGLAITGEHVVIQTTNYTSIGSGSLIGYAYDNGGDRKEYRDFQILGDVAREDLDIFIAPLDPNTPVEFRSRSPFASLARPQHSSINEGDHVDATRPRMQVDVTGLIESNLERAREININGSFVVSIWDWNLTVTSPAGRSDVPTGTTRTALAQDPVLRQQVVYQEFAQVAVLEVRNGSLTIADSAGAASSVFMPGLDLLGTGRLTVTGASILPSDQSGIPSGDLESIGEVAARIEAGSQPTILVSTLVGKATVDGAQIPLGNSGPLRSSTTVSDSPATPLWGWPLAIIGLMATAFLIKGPAMTGRFNRIQMRFDQHDYVGVLERIESFTHRSKYACRASFLKAVSLLSLNEFKEASLYLQTLAPHEAPEPATKAFLQACAAAGLGQDSTAINHLSECLKDDPSYIEEAKTVPALVGYLPYFSISPEEAAT